MQTRISVPVNQVSPMSYGGTGVLTKICALPSIMSKTSSGMLILTQLPSLYIYSSFVAGLCHKSPLCSRFSRSQTVAKSCPFSSTMCPPSSSSNGSFVLLSVQFTAGSDSWYQVSAFLSRDSVISFNASEYSFWIKSSSALFARSFAISSTVSPCSVNDVAQIRTSPVSAFIYTVSLPDLSLITSSPPTPQLKLSPIVLIIFVISRPSTERPVFHVFPPSVDTPQASAVIFQMISESFKSGLLCQ